MTPGQIDAFRELINIGVGRAASTLNDMLDTRIHLEVPFIRVLEIDDLVKETEELRTPATCAVQLTFRGDFSGVASLLFPTDSAAKLVAILTADDPEPLDFDAVRVGALNEVGNIVLNGVMGSIANVLKQRMKYSIPTYTENPIDKLLSQNDVDLNPRVLWAQTRFRILEHKIVGDIILLFKVGSFEALLSAIGLQAAVI